MINYSKKIIPLYYIGIFDSMASTSCPMIIYQNTYTDLLTTALLEHGKFRAEHCPQYLVFFGAFPLTRTADSWKLDGFWLRSEKTAFIANIA